MEEIQDEHENTAKGESGEEDFLHDWYLEPGLDELTKFDGRSVEAHRIETAGDEGSVDADSRLFEDLLDIPGKLVY